MGEEEGEEERENKAIPSWCLAKNKAEMRHQKVQEEVVSFTVASH